MLWSCRNMKFGDNGCFIKTGELLSSVRTNFQKNTTDKMNQYLKTEMKTQISIQWAKFIWLWSLNKKCNWQPSNKNEAMQECWKSYVTESRWVLKFSFLPKICKLYSASIVWRLKEILVCRRNNNSNGDFIVDIARPPRICVSPLF